MHVNIHNLETQMYRFWVKVLKSEILGRWYLHVKSCVHKTIIRWVSSLLLGL